MTNEKLPAMNIAQRILHVGGRNNAAGYVEFGSIQAVEALVGRMCAAQPAGAQRPGAAYAAVPPRWDEMIRKTFPDLHPKNWSSRLIARYMARELEALRSSHGQAPVQAAPAAVAVPTFEDFCKRHGLDPKKMDGHGGMWARVALDECRAITTQPSPAPQADPLQPVVALQEKAGMYADDFTPQADSQPAVDALAEAEYFIDNPSAWSSFDQRASDAIAAVCKAFRAARVPAPSKEEIDALVRAYLGDCGPQASRIYDFVTAVLAMASRPAQVADSALEDAARLDWLEADEMKRVFHLGKFWYTRASYGMPYRKRASLREAIDTARAAQEGK